MDTGTTIMGLGFLFFCIIIFLIMIQKNKKKEMKLLKALGALAKGSNCKIVQYDIWKNSAIGIDDATSILFFIRNTEDHSASFQIDLSAMQHCRIINSRKTESNEDGKFSVIEKLELAFTNMDKNKDDSILLFYTLDNDTFSLNGELQLIEKWYKITSNTIAVLSVSK